MEAKLSGTNSTSHATAAANIHGKLVVGSVNDPLETQADAVANQCMRMPANAVIQRKCSKCEEDEKAQRKPLTSFIQKKEASGNTSTVSDVVSDKIQLTKGHGASLDTSTKNFMESRFGTDFSNVRIHTDSQSVALSSELNARAFTVGNDVYFNSGKYSPESSTGKHLLAHELTHVVQQNDSLQMKMIQRACHEEGNPSIDVAACPEGAADVGRQAQGVANAIDPRAEGIIATAAGTGAASARAMQVVNDMLCTYMPSQAGKVRKITFFADEPGLAVQSVGSGPTTRGDICVGNNFLTGTTRSGISRRLLQLAHELEHIEQYRTGLAGGTNQDLREFLAFYHEGLADEFIGTGRMQHATRRRLIDAAIGRYFCLSSALQTTHQSKLTDLQTRRRTVDGTNGNAPVPAPTTCTR